MSVNATKEPTDRLPGGPTFRVAPGGQAPEQWCIVPVKEGSDAPASHSGYHTREAAQKECDRLNELWANWQEGDAERRDAVLGRMLKSKV